MLSFDPAPALASVMLTLGVGGSFGLIGAALALGFRHGIDWDHIAAITDITSTTAAAPGPSERWLTHEPGMMLTDESHHTLADSVEPADADGAPSAVKTRVLTGSVALDHSHGPAGHFHRHADGDLPGEQLGGVAAFIERQRPALLLGTMYAVGHGAVVFALGITAILAKQILPDWIDSVMERVVGVT